MNQLDYQCLLHLGACSYEVKLFRTVFGDGPVDITVENMEKARNGGLSVTFLLRAVSDEARAEYNKVRDKAQDEYWKVCDKAGAEWDKVRDKALAEYDSVCDKAYAEYYSVRGKALVTALLAS